MKAIDKDRVVYLEKVFFFFFFNLLIYLFRLVQVLVATCGIFSWSMQTLSCGMGDLVPRLGIEPPPPALGVQRFSH